MKQFQGRVICPGTCEAEALVSHGGFNTLASYQMALMFHDKQVKCGDQNNPDLYKKPMIGKALCLPETIGSTTGGMVLYTACASGQQPACTPIPDDEGCTTEVTPETTHIYCGGALLTFERLEADDVESLRQPENVALLDADKLTYPLTVRRWNEGDAFVPFGMDSRKKISDFLINNKVSLPDKRRQFVVTSGNDIVWVVGRRIDNRYKVAPATENVLRIVRETDVEI